MQNNRQRKIVKRSNRPRHVSDILDSIAQQHPNDDIAALFRKLNTPKG